ncbi:winged helix-turn-helix domain-containing protein [Sphingobium sp.]|uniref:winged helix-turn-helix domain-containing protein n=1 Tax=Sphingobium sp. TaxID=1912891 RepID=UPI0026065654|nr:winged helix-turn-helix domain-containing protein [Sphingobium sp.]
MSFPADILTLRVADLTLDLISRRVTRAGVELQLRPREIDVLAYMIWHRNRPIPAVELRERVWSLRFDPETNRVQVHISRLRDAMDRHFDQRLIHTISPAPGRRAYFFTEDPNTLHAWGNA